jgi:hypothetical protein
MVTVVNSNDKCVTVNAADVTLLVADDVCSSL